MVDVTDRKRAQMEAGRLRGELAHVSRVSTLGELAASLAAMRSTDGAHQ